jgi:hypothetical protein
MNGANWVSDMRLSLGLGCDGAGYVNNFLMSVPSAIFFLGQEIKRRIASLAEAVFDEGEE